MRSVAALKEAIEARPLNNQILKATITRDALIAEFLRQGDTRADIDAALHEMRFDLLDGIKGELSMKAPRK